MPQVFKCKSKLRATLLVLLFSGIIAAVGSWYTATGAGKFIAASNAEHSAEIWARRALNLLENGGNSFKNQTVSNNDKLSLAKLQSNSDAYRFAMYGPTGKVFWSSKESEIGAQDSRPHFKNTVMNGDPVVISSVKEVSQIDGFSAKHSGEKVNPAAQRHTTAVYIPVMQNGKFIGAFKIYCDVTNIFVWAEAYLKPIALFLGLVVLSVFMLIMGLLVSFDKDKEAKEKALLEAERDALDMHAQVEKVNREVNSLNQSLSANIKELNETQDQLIKNAKMAQLGQVTATVAHEIRNPLAAVRTSAYLVERKCEGVMTGLDKPFARIKKGIERCDRIITELLDFTRSANMDFQPTPVDEWVKLIVTEQAERLPDIVQFGCNLGLGKGFMAQVDTGFMERVLVNLLSNASEAMVGKGDDAAFITTYDALIIVTTRETNRGVEIVITDNGPGITPKNMGQILQPLFTTKNFGVGLGLPAVEKILNQHNGGLEITSIPGEGASIIAWFPQTQPQEEFIGICKAA